MDEVEKKSTIDAARESVIRVEYKFGRHNPDLRKHLKEQYPFSRREGYPYQAWLRAIRERIGGMRIKKPDPNQLPLFQEDKHVHNH
ncbi:hypothetical protein [Flavobacterium sp.]|uniref:hypothetical protein n=1 Tax=Flavobacterium sp. TaxID=239 RepID=UPI00260AD654|nr:hypothetical protein [Flavobacterium sp.]